MSEINHGGPAFPFAGDGNETWAHEGMTLRDYFAAKAMQVGYERYWRRVEQLEADGITAVTAPDDWRDVIATNAYRLADAMLRARSGK